MKPRPSTVSDPASPKPPHAPEDPQFLSASALQDPTLRTPGSEIPEAVYAASDSESFDLTDLSGLHGLRPTQPLAPSPNPRITLILVLLLLAIIAATVTYLYRNTHRPAPAPSPPPAHAAVVHLQQNRLT